ncbi:zinc ribbon domain-containing protein [Psychromonas aquatilis]|uniref:Zinc ribbon domain-containing protein n=1 Tax=Psychromonas aquatilis TaxID=2005072 RepID=A0ABU9GRF9_9GAMM
MDLHCPHCDNKLERNAELTRFCPACHEHYDIKIDCDQCGGPLQRLKACGAVNLWCDSCNELKSKSNALYRLVKQDS